jgi:hypothetical protein
VRPLERVPGGLGNSRIEESGDQVTPAYDPPGGHEEIVPLFRAPGPPKAAAQQEVEQPDAEGPVMASGSKTADTSAD